MDPHPNAGNKFGDSVAALSTGNVVITSPYDDAGGKDAGAVYLFSGSTGALISTLRGSNANDKIGAYGISKLNNGNYVISSPYWDNGPASDAGAATWGNGTTGISGVVSSVNSLVGSKSGDFVSNRGIAELANGNYVVRSTGWDNGTAKDAGAATWGNGTMGIFGNVSPSNSLVGTSANDNVGAFVTALTNGNYVVGSLLWNNGAATDAGAATWGNGTTGIVGAVSPANSLVGTTAGDFVGSNVTPLRNGNFVTSTHSWHNGAASEAGAATWGDGAIGIVGAVSATNSLVGSKSGDMVGYQLTPITALRNGNYLVRSASWTFGAPDAGAVTLGNGTSGTVGVVNETNSLVGKRPFDRIGSGGIVALANGNYVVGSPDWDNETITDTGAVTWGNGKSGSVGFVSPANSLTGVKSSDFVGSHITALANGNFVVGSPYWDNGEAIDAGAVTWGNGSNGMQGVVSTSNSLVGSTSFDYIGEIQNNIVALTNGNYVVGSPNWNNGMIVDAGAATWGSGLTGIVGNVSPANSLVGRKYRDQVGLEITALRNGNYVVISPFWSNGAAKSAGAVTWGNGTTGTIVAVSATNSIVGSQSGDYVGFGGIIALTNGNYVVRSENWFNGTLRYAGAATLGRGTARTTAIVSTANSLVGLTGFSKLGTIIPDPVNNAFYARFVNEVGGRVRVGSTISPI